MVFVLFLRLAFRFYFFGTFVFPFYRLDLFSFLLFWAEPSGFYFFQSVVSYSRLTDRTFRIFLQLRLFLLYFSIFLLYTFGPSVSTPQWQSTKDANHSQNSRHRHRHRNNQVPTLTTIGLGTRRRVSRRHQGLIRT